MSTSRSPSVKDINKTIEYLSTLNPSKLYETLDTFTPNKFDKILVASKNFPFQSYAPDMTSNLHNCIENIKKYEMTFRLNKLPVALRENMALLTGVLSSKESLRQHISSVGATVSNEEKYLIETFFKIIQKDNFNRVLNKNTQDRIIENVSYTLKEHILDTIGTNNPIVLNYKTLLKNIKIEYTNFKGYVNNDLGFITFSLLIKDDNEYSMIAVCILNKNQIDKGFECELFDDEYIKDVSITKDINKLKFVFRFFIEFIKFYMATINVTKSDDKKINIEKIKFNYKANLKFNFGDDMKKFLNIIEQSYGSNKTGGGKKKRGKKST